MAQSAFGAGAGRLSEYFTQNAPALFPSQLETPEIRYFFNLARPLLHYSRPHWFHANEGAVQRFSGPLLRPFFLFPLSRKRESEEP